MKQVCVRGRARRCCPLALYDMQQAAVWSLQAQADTHLMPCGTECGGLLI